MNADSFGAIRCAVDFRLVVVDLVVVVSSIVVVVVVSGVVAFLSQSTNCRENINIFIQTVISNYKTFDFFQ